MLPPIISCPNISAVCPILGFSSFSFSTRDKVSNFMNRVMLPNPFVEGNLTTKCWCNHAGYTKCRYYQKDYSDEFDSFVHNLILNTLSRQ